MEVEELRLKEIDVGGLTLLLGNHQPSFTSVLRAVKRAEHGILNCISSIVHDYEFVGDVAAAFSPFPLLPNLRCGLWYAAATTDNCYFKSTDGHSGEWSFSTSRLNLHVAQIAMQHGGVCVVDATRRGKTFPDALTKTIPIWATVLNRAIAKLKSTATTATTSSDYDKYFSEGASLDLHLPHWISKNEKHQMEQRLDGWVDELLSLGIDLTLLESSLQKPLHCVWVSQEVEEDWLEIAENEELKSKYTLLVLISASIPNKRQRRRLFIDSNSSFSKPTSHSRTESNDDTSSTSSTSSSDAFKYISNNNRSKKNFSLVFNEPLDLMYDYIPGAGDDEESWAKGLTPSLMWENIEELLRARPEDVGDIVKKLVKSKSMSDRAQKRTGAGARAVGGNCNSSSARSEWKVEWIAECIGIGLSSTLPAEIFGTAIRQEIKDGFAILNVGCTASYSLFETEEGASGSAGRYMHIPIAGDKNLKRAVLHAVPAAVQFASNSISSSLSTGKLNRLLVVAEPEAIDIAASIVLAILIACFGVEVKECSIMWSSPAGFFPSSTTQLIPAVVSNCFNDEIDRDKFTRSTVRQYLSIVSAYYPQVVLSKSLLKQIYNAFLPDSMVRPPGNEEPSLK